MKAKLFLLVLTAALALANGHSGAVSFGASVAVVIGLFALILGWTS